MHILIFHIIFAQQTLERWPLNPLTVYRLTLYHLRKISGPQISDLHSNFRLRRRKSEIFHRKIFALSSWWTCRQIKIEMKRTQRTTHVFTGNVGQLWANHTKIFWRIICQNYIRRSYPKFLYISGDKTFFSESMSRYRYFLVPKRALLTLVWWM